MAEPQHDNALAHPRPQALEAGSRYPQRLSICASYVEQARTLTTAKRLRGTERKLNLIRAGPRKEAG
eukprot:868879-Pyramimonas_sp.AAC.1